ncbi:Glycosyltransferase involved in cell wall bisynthesis [Lutibacter agarilyticus]|uniref:Glycosyltransferase involved in cell wall bisynthesis n=1 Tax=Lutibacter agarilyticus TaxID=1109740 RepID=A0A238WU06_9FLAO|nr:glycosyltransferase [Lutibacter agarilyticus]SNR49908.1 Glycosyltransferase involved in cell wall bisynthesis [Lutibacter agarilyticus]
MNIIFDPSFNPRNKYISIIVEGLKKSGFNVKSFGDSIRSPRFFISASYVHLNWFEGIQGDKVYNIILLFLKQLFKLVILLIFNKKIIWTMHNKVSHDNKASHYSRVLTWLLIKFSDKIVIHSHLSRNILVEKYNKPVNKIYYIPHPNYIDVYKDFKKGTNVENREKLKILFFGAVKQYKNIELIVKAAKEFEGSDIEFSIIGSPNSKTYANSLKELVKHTKNINLSLSFIEDSKLVEEIGNHDIIVLPYSISSSLNSGSVILAFSLKKTVICPNIGTVLDVKDHIKVFSYDYASEEEHFLNLKKQLKQVYNEWIKDKYILDEYGYNAYRYILENNDITNVISKYHNLYKV